MLQSTEPGRNPRIRETLGLWAVVAGGSQIARQFVTGRHLFTTSALFLRFTPQANTWRPGPDGMEGAAASKTGIITRQLPMTCGPRARLAKRVRLVIAHLGFYLQYAVLCHVCQSVDVDWHRNHKASIGCIGTYNFFRRFCHSALRVYHQTFVGGPVSPPYSLMHRRGDRDDWGDASP